MAALGVGTLLNPLNSSMIAVALIALSRDFGLTTVTVTWVVTVFYLASAALQPLMGRLADRFGPRRLFGFGMAVVAVTCVLTPLAPSFGLVCAGRVLLALGTATAFPSAMAMLRALAASSGGGTTRFLGRIQMANTLGAAVGPVLGGVLVGTLGWQAIFWVNVPLALAASLGVRALAPGDPPRARLPLARLVAETDVPGVLAFLATLVPALAFLLGLRAGPDWVLVPVAVVAGALFVRRERRCATPFLDVRLLAANRPLVKVYLGFAVFNVVYYCAFFGLPQFLEVRGGYATPVVGLLMLPLAAATVAATPLVTRLVERRGVRAVLVLGGSALVVGAGLMSLVAVTTAPAVALLVTAAMGVPYCAVNIAMNQALYSSARPEDAGVAAGMFQTSRYLGAILATTLLGAVFAAGTTPAAWLVVVGVAVLVGVGLLALFVLWRPREARGPGV